MQLHVLLSEPRRQHARQPHHQQVAAERRELAGPELAVELREATVGRG